ncbi:AsnC family transcriptional regulator [Mesorhizobium sp. M1423]|uniref:Lrp/AsnC family transcriptional regulator n=1 Tax=Mesorhizobium sp. M1423 TaxID=2957101 RepID=UPI003337DB3D
MGASPRNERIRSRALGIVAINNPNGYCKWLCLNSRTVIDDLDRRILGTLQKNNRLSFAEIADLVGSSAASCMRRVNRLRADGIHNCRYLPGGSKGARQISHRRCHSRARP